MAFPVRMVESAPVIGGYPPKTQGGSGTSPTPTLRFGSESGFANQIMLVCNVGESTLDTTGDVVHQVFIEVDKNNSGSWETWTDKGVKSITHNNDGSQEMVGQTVIFNVTQEELNEAYPTQTYPDLKFRGQSEFASGTVTGGWVYVAWIELASGLGYGVSGDTNATLLAEYPKRWKYVTTADDGESSLELFCTPDGS